MYIVIMIDVWNVIIIINLVSSTLDYWPALLMYALSCLRRQYLSPV